jgi:prevent-host-death family protein
MNLRASDIVPISEARARLTELAQDVVDGESEKVLTKNGVSYVAIIDARKLDYYHALGTEHANLVLLSEAEAGLKQILAGQRITSADLDALLAE